MTDEDEAVEPVKASKRDRLKGALSRTKTKFKRKEIPDGDADYKPVHDDVDDFLARGRNSTSTGRPSISESFASGTPSTSDSLAFHPSPESIIPDPNAQPQPSPRRIVVPKIDVSASQRWPGARPVGQHSGDSNDLLKPEYQSRSQSVSSLSKRRGRARGLSVTFTNKLPVVIGEGGDEAQTATIEVSRAKARARSASPVPTPRAAGPETRPWSRSPQRRKPLPEHSPLGPRPPETALPFPGVKRIQTGMSPSPAPNESKIALEKEFEMSLGLGPASTNPTGSYQTPGEYTHIHAPKPVHPPTAYPDVKNMPILHELKPVPASKNLRSQFEEGAERPASRDAALTQHPPPRYYEQESQNLPNMGLSHARRSEATQPASSRPYGQQHDTTGRRDNFI